MAGSIDTSNRKPRRTRGTPAYHHRNRFALGAIVLGSALFAAFYSLPIFNEINEKVERIFMNPTEEELERKYLFSFIPRKRAEDILKIMEEEEQLKKER